MFSDSEAPIYHIIISKTKVHLGHLDLTSMTVEYNFVVSDIEGNFKITTVFLDCTIVLKCAIMEEPKGHRL